MEIFKVYYKKYLLNSHDSVMVLWNHPILLYLRKTVNENSDINPICKFCKNNEIAYIRNRYPDKYAKLRDFAITEFFKKFNALFTKVPFYDGLVVLSENPHSDKRYLEITNP